MESCLRMEQFRKNVIKEVNNSQLTVGAAYFIMKDILNELRFMYMEEVEKDKAKIQKPMVKEQVTPLVEFEDENGEKHLYPLEDIGEVKEIEDNGEQNND